MWPGRKSETQQLASPLAEGSGDLHAALRASRCRTSTKVIDAELDAIAMLVNKTVAVTTQETGISRMIPPPSTQSRI